MYRQILKSVRHFISDENGPTAVEYAVLLALIIILCVASIEVLGTSASDSLDDSATKINAATGN